MLIRCQPEDFHNAPNYYNRLPHVDNQQRDISASILDKLGDLFLRHAMHTEFGIALLHRHCDTSPTSVMVHTKTDQDVCVPQELGLRKIRPVLFIFCRTREEYMPLEFEAASESWTERMPSESFLCDLASFLRSESLDTVLGLSRLSSTEDPWFEFMRSDGPGTIAFRSAREINVSKHRVTEWAFSSTNGVLCIKAVKGCRTTISGVHEPTKDDYLR